MNQCPEQRFYCHFTLSSDRAELSLYAIRRFNGRYLERGKSEPENLAYDFVFFSDNFTASNTFIFALLLRFCLDQILR